ncbi:MAG: hypothetical protein R3C11_24675 [Planctomycetaceae bacterium]
MKILNEHSVRLRSGFTLAELLVATILATMMLAAVLAFLTGMTRQQRQLEKSVLRKLGKADLFHSWSGISSIRVNSFH